MSKLVTLVPTLPKRGVWANQTVILPSLGEQTFDAQGNLTVPEDKVLLLLRETKESFGFTVLPTPAAGDAAPGGELTGEPTAGEPATVVDGSGDHQPPPELSDEDRAKLDELSAKAAGDREIREKLDAMQLPELLILAAEFPDLTKEKIAIMSDAKLRKELYDRLTKE